MSMAETVVATTEVDGILVVVTQEMVNMHPLN